MLLYSLYIAHSAYSQHVLQNGFPTMLIPPINGPSLPRIPQHHFSPQSNHFPHISPKQRHFTRGFINLNNCEHKQNTGMRLLVDFDFKIGCQQQIWVVLIDWYLWHADNSALLIWFCDWV